jgi:hypothetical protein
LVRVVPLPPSVELTQSITTGTAWFKDLSQETPERYAGAKDSLPTVRSSWLRSQELLGNKLAEKLLIVADSRTLGRAAQELLESGERSFTEKTPMKISKKRGDRRHLLSSIYTYNKASFYRAKKYFNPGTDRSADPAI